MLKCHEFTITLHHVWSVEEKLLLGRSLMGQYVWKVLSSELTLEQPTCNWEWSTAAQEGLIWHTWQREHEDRMTTVGLPITIPELDLWNLSLLCVWVTQDWNRWRMTEIGCEPYSWLRQSPGYQMSCKGNLGQEDLRKSLRQLFIQECRARSLGP